MEERIEHNENDFSYVSATPANKSSTDQNVTSAAITSRQSQEVQAAIFLAKQFPRDEQAAYQRIMRACKRRKLAESAEYEFPRGGSNVNGPSIRLAEAIAQAWGNIDFGIMELEQKLGESTVMAYCWDLETNTRQTKVFTVKHERKAQGRINKLTDPRDIYEMVANQGARRVRACIMGIIPGDVVDDAVAQCRQTLQGSYSEPLQDRLRKAVSMFQERYGVTQDMLETYIGKRVDAFSENDFTRISNVFRALRDGMAKPEAYFDMKPSRPDTTSQTEEQFKEQQKKMTSSSSTSKQSQKTEKEAAKTDESNTGKADADPGELPFE